MSPRKQPRCRTCQAPIVFFRRPGDGKALPFDLTPLSSGHPLAGVDVHPIYGRRAWKTRDLAEQLQVLHEISSTEAEQQVRDMEWRRVHRCEQDAGDSDG